MKTTQALSACLALWLSGSQASAQETSKRITTICQTDEVMEELYRNNPEAKKEAEEFERYTAGFSKSFEQQKNMANCYVIPVVFHVYGTTQGGYPVNLSIIQGALNNWVNKDFHGTNTDFASVHSQFQSIKATMPDITFALAQLDPNGNPTTGVVNHPVTSGFGNGSGYDNLIAADAWNNYKYMNIYVMNDLYNNGTTTNSGVAWYPSTNMSNNNTARVVYNGAYLGVNCNSWEPEFASVLTHECGHWLNLIHTFNGGCTSPNDNVSDTPPCDYNNLFYTCHGTSTSNSPLNCNNQLVNAENYMDYSGADGCYKMFTAGQATRVYAALQHASRQPLWQQSNLNATGLGNMCSSTGIQNNENIDYAGIFPNPTDGKTTLTLSLQKVAEFKLTISDVLGRNVSSSSQSFAGGDNRVLLNLEKEPAGIYFVQLQGEGATKTIYLMKD